MPELRPTLSPGVDGDRWTMREIRQQPETLRKTQASLSADRVSIEAFVGPLLGRRDMRIVLTGAGTSAFIGESLAPWLSARLHRTVEAIATTDIVSMPTCFLRPEIPTLLVSFGRSGNSPESVATVQIADTLLAEVHHLVITCNAGGALGALCGAGKHVVVLPDATHDRGFAMTSSFTAMLLAARSILSGIEATDARVPPIADAVDAVLTVADPIVTALAARRFDRVVYLGSGVFKGLAHEAALKVMELSDGAVVTTFDSPMGFRHGPKAIVTSNTLVMVFIGNDPIGRRYDLDILDELRADGRAGAVVAIAAQPLDGDAIVVAGLDDADDADLLCPFVAIAQLYGVRVSQHLELVPDRPNASGTVNRVVQGVRIHPLTA